MYDESQAGPALATEAEQGKEDGAKRLKELEQENVWLKDRRGFDVGQRNAQGTGGGKLLSPVLYDEMQRHIVRNALVFRSAALAQ
jgi:hypothetical protein